VREADRTAEREVGGQDEVDTDARDRERIGRHATHTEARDGQGIVSLAVGRLCVSNTADALERDADTGDLRLGRGCVRSGDHDGGRAFILCGCRSGDEDQTKRSERRELHEMISNE